MPESCDQFPAGARTGVSAQSFQRARAFAFGSDRCPEATAPQAVTDCPESGLSFSRGQLGKRVTCSCSSAAMRQTRTDPDVWGTDVYMAQSSVCRAAAHAGAVGQAGGLVQLELRENCRRYDGSARNGITSGAPMYTLGDVSMVFPTVGGGVCPAE
jgi:hypothetical protein